MAAENQTLSVPEGMYNYNLSDTRKEKVEDLALSLLHYEMDNTDTEIDSRTMRSVVKAAKFFYDEIDRQMENGDASGCECKSDTLDAVEKILNVIIGYEKTDDENETMRSLDKIINVLEDYKTNK